MGIGDTQETFYTGLSVKDAGVGQLVVRARLASFVMAAAGHAAVADHPQRPRRAEA